MQLESWLLCRAKTLEVWTSVRNAEGDLREAEADAGAARAKLVTAFAAAGIPHDVDASFETLLAVAHHGNISVRAGQVKKSPLCTLAGVSRRGLPLQ
jgi:hypothetical protein